MSDILRKVEVKPRIEDFNHNSRFLFESDWSLLYSKPPELIALPELIAGKQSVEYLTVNTGRTTAPKTTEEDVEFTEGVIYYVRFTYGTSVANPTLNGVPIQLGITNASTTTLSIADNANVVVPMFYDATRNTLQLLGSHRTSDSTESYVVRYNQALEVQAPASSYPLLAQNISTGKYHAIYKTNTNNDVNNAVEFAVNGPILYDSSSAAITVNTARTTTIYAGQVMTGTNIIKGITGQSNTSPLFLVGEVGPNGGFVPYHDVSRLSYQVGVPSNAATNREKLYWYVGYYRNSTTIRLELYHPCYYMDSEGNWSEYSKTDLSLSNYYTKTEINTKFETQLGNKLPVNNPAFTGTLTGPSIELTGNIKVGNSNTLSNEGFELNGTAAVGLRVTNTHGYISISPLNSSWAHIYTDRNNFIFNKSVYSIENAFSSYSTNDLLLQRNAVTKLTLGDTLSTFATNVSLKAPTITSGATYVSVFNADPNTTTRELKSITIANLKTVMSLNNVANTSNYLPTDATGKVTTDIEFATTKKIKNTSEVEFYDKAKIVYDDTSKSLKFIFS